MKKKEIRAIIKQKRLYLDPDWIHAQSALVQSQLAALPGFDQSQLICCYLALPGEVRTDMIVEKSWQAGKELCVPAYSKEEAVYRLARFEQGADLELGHFNVFEPKEKNWVSEADVSMMVVPGLAFDAAGGRVGHGAGHYDRMLAKTQSGCLKVGLAFDFQMFETVPSQEHDIRMNSVCFTATD